MIKILHNLALFLVKNANLFAEFFGENISKIITSVPDLSKLFLRSPERPAYRVDGRPNIQRKLMTSTWRRRWTKAGSTLLETATRTASSGPRYRC
jgi:hypothetical protein